MHISEMVDTNPAPAAFATRDLAACIEACFDCAQSCNACADACLGESRLEMLTPCIRLNQDCADLCLVTGRVLSRQQHVEPRLFRSTLEACLLACQICGDECSCHAQHHEHCRICADACRACATACQKALDELAAPPRQMTH